MKRFISVLLILATVFSIPMVGIYGTAADEGQIEEMPFTDVHEGDWFYESVKYMYKMGMMNGVAEDKFSPNTATNRAMLVTMLYRLEQNPAVEGESSFDDVDEGKWYTDAVKWASSVGVVNGYAPGLFGPENELTREQMAAIMYRYAAYKAYDLSHEGDVSSFTDSKKISGFAKEPMTWAVGVGLIGGVGNGRLDPKGFGTRAQVATIFMRFCDDVVPEEYTVEFNFNYEGAPASQTVIVTEGTLIEAPALPEREGYVFGGWYKDVDAILDKYDLSLPATESVTLYAKWNADVQGESVGTDDSVTVYSVTYLSADSEAGTVTARVSAPENCALIVRFIEEDVYFSEDYAGDSYYNNGYTFASTAIPAGSATLEVTVEVNGNLPDNFVAEAVLIDSGAQPLCDPYTDITNTERYAEYDAKTIYDGAEEGVVLNFDESEDNNFGVLADDVKVMTAEDVNGVDNDDDGYYDVYEIDTPSGDIVEGDKIFIRDKEGDFIFKVQSVTEEDGIFIVIIAFADDETYGYDLGAFYKFLKIDMEYDNDEDGSIVQNEDGSYTDEIEGSNSWLEIPIINVYENHTAETSLSLTFPIESGCFAASASAEGKLSANLVLQLDVVLFGESYFRCDFTYSTDLTAKLEVVAKIDHDGAEDAPVENKVWELKGGRIQIPFGVTGLSAFADINLCVEWELNAGLSAEVGIKTTNGFKYNTKTGFQKVEKKDIEWKVECKGHAELKFGPKPSVGVSFLSKVVEIKLECFLGGIIEADAALELNGTDGDDKHACIICIEGKVKACVSVHAKLTINAFDIIKGTPIDWNIITHEKELFKFYLSIANEKDSMFGGHFHAGIGECPNKKYKTTFYSKDANGNAVSTEMSIYNSDGGFAGKVDSSSYTYLAPGTYEVTAYIDGDNYSKEFTVANGIKTVTVNALAKDGAVKGSVLDAYDSSVLTGAIVKIYEHTTCINTLETDDSGDFSCVLDQGEYTIVISKEGYVDATRTVSLRDGEVKQLGATRLVKKDESSIMGGIYGTINDGLTGEAVSDVEIKISKGWDNSEEEPEYVAERTTDYDGEYSLRKRTIMGVDFGLDAGNYTVTISKEGYITTTFNITIVAGEDMEFNSTITPVGAENVYRVVLTWGYSPSDLDSHLNGPYKKNTYDHVYFNRKNGYGAELDVDDVTSYGPETITIYDIGDYTGNVKYSVHDYTNRGSSNSKALSNSGATVKVYRGGQHIETFNVPAGVSATVWNVFYISYYDGIVPVNSFDNIYNPSEVMGDDAAA